jgi:hypothetical protein
MDANEDPEMVAEYLDQVREAVAIVRRFRGERAAGKVTEEEFAAHSLQAVLCTGNHSFLSEYLVGPPAA